MTNLSEQFREKSRNLQEYVLACENFIGAIDQMKAAIEKMGSDPLGAMDYLTGASEQAAPVPTPDQEKIARFAPGLMPSLDEGPHFPERKPEGAFEEAVAETIAEDSDKPPVPLEQMPEPDAPAKARVVGRANQTRPRGPLTDAILKAQTWLYKQLMAGPKKRNDIEELAKKAGINMYRVNEARRHSDDIVQVTVGLRGPSWWYILGDEDKLPNGKSKTKVEVSPEERPVLEAVKENPALGAPLAAIIGMTGLKPDRVRDLLGKLQTRGAVTLDKKSGTWKAVAA